MADVDDNILELAANRPRPGTWGRPGNAGTRYVRTPEGAEKYGLPIGAPITADAIARAKARGRNYTVPEDDKRFGSKAPAAGRTQRNVKEIVAAIRNSPAPRVVTPEGPKKIGVGERGYGFPEGSRAFRSQKHENFVIVRTPDYQLVVATDRGIAFELDGELERELNEQLDDDRSPDFVPDEPNPNLGAPDAEGADAPDGPEVDSFRPDNLEDMPGYLSEDRINDILSGMEEAGLDQGSRDAAELQLRRNNDRIREEFNAAEAPGGPDGSEPEQPPMPTKPAAKAEAIRSQLPGAERRPETVPNPTPDRQPEPEEPAAQPKQRPAKKQERETPARKAPSAESGNSATDDEQLATLEELTRSRPTGTAEGEVNGKRVSVRRNRVNDAMEYAADDEPFQDRESLLENTRKRVAPEEPRDTTDMEPSELSDQELDDVLADIDDALRAGLISRREARGRRTALAAERNRRTGDAPEEPEEREDPETPDSGIEPGNETTREWAESAQPGAAAQTADGIVAQRTEDGWETPLGTVQTDFLGESDVLDDQTIVVRNEPEPDDRPIGATAQVTSPEEMESVRAFDSIVYQDKDGNAITATRRRDGDFDLRFPDGLRLDAVDPEILLGSIEEGDVRLWHVPNQDMPEAPSRESWESGNTLKSMTDLAAQKPGTQVRLRFRRPVLGRTESVYTVQGDGRLKGENGSIYPASHIQPGVRGGRVSVAELPTRDIPDSEIETPRVVEDPNEYIDGDVISDYRHLRDMRPGQRVTLVVPASENGGREAQVVLTRTRDEADLGGFMFLVGNGGRGYNSFGENNANLFQAIYDGRLHFGDIKRMPDAGPERRIGGDWSRERNISLWEGGPDVSEYDLRTFIASQVASTAMQGSYYDVTLLPEDSPFRSRQLRDEFSARAIAQYSSAGNPARHKPAMIRLAAEKLGMQYTEPGSTLLPDNLTIEDFNTQVTLGRWLRSTGTSAEANMGPEQIKVTRADIKTALAVLDNMQVSDAQGDPDKILKRVFARQGSPLQDLNVAVAIASYFRMRRYKADSNRPMTTIARQYDKRRNRELLRQMLREQLEGREPGYYGVPEDEVYERNGVTYTNRSGLSRPTTHVGNDENPNAVPAPREESLADVQAEIDAEAADAATEQETRTEGQADGTDPVNAAVEHMGASTDEARQALRDQLAPGMRNKGFFEGTSNGRLDGNEFSVVRDDEGKITGYANWYIARYDSPEDLAELDEGDEPFPPTYTLVGLYASTDHSGSGTALMESLARRAKADNGELSVQGAVASAHSFYARTGADMREGSSVGTWSEEARDRLAAGSTPITRRNAAPETPSWETRLEELDDFDNARDAYLSAREQNDAVAYIREVLGAKGLRRGSGTVRDQFTRAWNQRNGVSTEEPAAPETPANDDFGFEITDERRAEFDAMSTEDAWRSAQQNFDALNYIMSVMGRDGVTALNDGTLSMRAQFYRAHEQANPDTHLNGRPAAPTATVGQELGASEIGSLPAGSNVEYTRRDGRVSVYTRTDTGWTTARGGTPEPESWTRARFRVSRVGPNAAVDSSAPETSETTDLDPRFAQGGSFTGSSIREAPLGSHIRGASGTEYRVTETGVQALGPSGITYEFATIERADRNFTYVGDTAPDAPVSAVAQTAPDQRIGSWFEASELLSLPQGGFVRSSGGTVWKLNGSYITSQTSGVRRRVRNLSGRFRYLGNDAGAAPSRAQGTPQTARTLEQAGLTRVPQDVITRYDAPRPMPEVGFDTSNTVDFEHYTSTPAGIEDLKNTIRAALPEGSRVEVSSSGRSFTARYSTPDGSTGSMSRALRGNGRIENAVAHAGGANFSAVQDHLFAFYRQHGLTEVEVHGLSSRGWNGAHTWIRRGFRPDPDREGANFTAFSRLRDNLSRIISRTERGEFPEYVEFLEEAKDLARRMTDLLNMRQNLMIEERNERLYQLWRELTYLAEVRGRDGRTARGRRQSIGWRLLGNQSSETWYYGLRDLESYFEN
ncbi:hypothetical protein SEA_MAGRITTE_17 [Microbacterium phage Magritte]|nr:hypothetical protein SEA_MAGRITTE_17 [Microbacterium phage Magritte]